MRSILTIALLLFAQAVPPKPKAAKPAPLITLNPFAYTITSTMWSESTWSASLDSTYRKLTVDDPKHVLRCAWGALSDSNGEAIGFTFTCIKK